MRSHPPKRTPPTRRGPTRHRLQTAAAKTVQTACERRVAARRRVLSPIRPKPPISIAQVAGSGTAAVAVGATLIVPA